MISINYRDARPIYEQVRDSFRALILSDALAPGYKMPSVRELASSLAINPNTIQRAYRELENEGYIVSVPGKGSFVSPSETAVRQHIEQTKAQLAALAAELRALGIDEEELVRLIKEGDEGK